MHALEDTAHGEVFDAELAELRANWDDPQYHAALLHRFAEDHDLSFVGGLYRRIRDEDPSRREKAEAQIDKLFRTALRSVHPERSLSPHPPNRLRFLVLGIACFTAAYLVLWIVHRL